MPLKHFALCAALACAPAPALAHAAKRGPHGGQQSDAGGFHVEVVTTQAKLAVYLYSHALKPIDATQFKGVAIVKAADGRPVRIVLEPAGDNVLSGVAPSPLPAQIDGAVQITPQTGASVLGKFFATDKSDDRDDDGHAH